MKNTITSNTFYCIKLINSNGERGWLFDSPEGIKIITGGLHSNITQFTTEKDALSFIRDRKIERGGIKAYVRTNQEIIEEVQIVENKGISVMDRPMYHLENDKGEKCFYDSTQEVYFFKQMGDFGYPVWDSEEKVRTFAREMKFEQSLMFMVKHYDKSKKEKTLIQVYGCRKKEDGTMSEPEYIDIKEGDNYKL